MTVSMQLKGGLWYGVVSYKNEIGKHQTKWLSTGLTERGNKKAAKDIVDKKLEEFEREIEESKNKIERRSKPKEVDKSLALMLFSKYCDMYVDSIKNKIEPGTYKAYKEYVKKIRNYFDQHKLRVIDVTEDEIKNFYAELRNSGIKNVSIRKYSCVLRPAIKQAYKDKLVPDNPYELISHISKEKYTANYYNQNEMSDFFEKIEGDKFELPLKLASYYGIRRSELIGLRWKTIDFENKTITINHKVISNDGKYKLTDTDNLNVNYVLSNDGRLILSDKLKTDTSYRTLPLFPEIERLLLEKKSEIEDNKLFFGTAYSQEFLHYVFVDDIGKLVHPNVLSNNFKKILKENNLKEIRFHDLRHSCASIMLANAISLKQIQEWLGHANFSTTADVYSHLDYSSKINSANAIISALGSKKKSRTLKDEQELFKNMLSEMTNLGFSDITEYFEYLEKNANDILVDDITLN